MKYRQFRAKYIKFFVERGHREVPSASTVPENDPTVLFTTAGMQPLVPYLLGEKHPQGTRLVSAQKCVRTDDIDEVGDATHHTFFEMLGNWSLGDYFKDQSILWSYELLTDPQHLSLDKTRLAVSVFAGDDDAPFDQEAHDKWLGLGFSENKIARMPKRKNWWGPAGETGPCGPDTEIFYWVGAGDPPANFQDTYDNPCWVEIWNNVFMQYNKERGGHYSLLMQRNVDTGMGLERMLAVMNGLDDNYKTDLFSPIIDKIEAATGQKYEDRTREFRIIADHLRASVILISDGVEPSNKERGYVVRKLLRRALLHIQSLSQENSWVGEIVDIVAEIYKESYPLIEKRSDQIRDVIMTELSKYEKTIAHGKKIIEKMETLTAKDAFDLYQTYGFPFELSKEYAALRGIKISEEDYQAEFQKHQDLSRTASVGMFKGGLADASDQTVKLHTAAHLLLESLRRVLGQHVFQRGSNITPERLRFDFSQPEKMTPEQLKMVEDMVNDQIGKDLPVTMQELPLKEARESGATGIFENKYGEIVKVYTIGASDKDYFSKEICGGPHVKRTSELGKFKIFKEESSSSGVRRIKAILN